MASIHVQLGRRGLPMNGVSPAGSPSLPLGDGPGGETPPELAGETPALLPGRFMGPLGIAPDPIAFLDFCAATGGEERRFTAIVRLVPAHRVEHELTVVGLLVVERLARDDVVRKPLQETRGQGLELVGIGPVGQARTL